MKKMKFCLACVFGFIALYACNSRTEIARQQLVGINGSADYFFNEDGKVDMVVKPEFETDDYVVMIERDTVKIGEKFIGTFHVADSTYNITVLNPTNETIVSGSNHLEPKNYFFISDRIGEFEFSGIIKWDSVEVPFRYKFLVVGK